ncbi:hypothetical protein ACI784_12220 [Geodermatophilus sp. SYSU D01186]
MPTRSPGDESRGSVPGLQGPGTAEEESPDAPAIPSFESLRGPRRRTAVDLIVPATPPPAEDPPAPGPAAGRPATAGGPRPAEYADLLRLGSRAVRAVVGVPVRVAGWPVRCVRRLLGGS